MDATAHYQIRYVHVQSEHNGYVAHVGVASGTVTLDVPIRLVGAAEFAVEYARDGAAHLRNPTALAAALDHSCMAQDEAGKEAEVLGLLARSGGLLAIRVELAHLSELYAASGYRTFAPAAA